MPPWILSTPPPPSNTSVAPDATAEALIASLPAPPSTASEWASDPWASALPIVSELVPSARSIWSIPFTSVNAVALIVPAVVKTNVSCPQPKPMTTSCDFRFAALKLKVSAPPPPVRATVPDPAVNTVWAVAAPLYVSVPEATMPRH